MHVVVEHDVFVVQVSGQYVDWFLLPELVDVKLSFVRAVVSSFPDWVDVAETALFLFGDMGCCLGSRCRYETAVVDLDIQTYVAFVAVGECFE